MQPVDEASMQPVGSISAALLPCTAAAISAHPAVHKREEEG
jgi:hypothetical protein